MVLNHKKFNQIIKELIFKYLIVKNVKILKKVIITVISLLWCGALKTTN